MAEEAGDGTEARSVPSRGDWIAQRQARRFQAQVGSAVGAGVLLSVVGFVLGVTMIAHRRALSCPDGTAFPADGTDLQCFAQPTVPEGVAVAVISLLLGLVIALLGLLVNASLDASARNGSR